MSSKTKVPLTNAELPTRGILQVDRGLFPNGLDPDAYCLRLSGHCMEPEIYDDDMIVCSPATRLATGQMVALWLTGPGRPVAKRLLMAPPILPHEIHPGSTAMPVIEIETINPRRRFMAQFRAIHTIVAVMRPEEYMPTWRAAKRRSFTPLQRSIGMNKRNERGAA